MKKILLGASMLLTMGTVTLMSCSDDNDDNTDGNTITTTEQRYYGTFVTHMYAGPNDFGATGNIFADYCPSADHTTDTIKMYEVKFSSMMPVSLGAIAITPIKYNNGILSQESDSITPLVLMAGVWANYEDKKIAQLNGTLTNDSLNVEMTCGGLPLLYNGGIVTE